MNTELISSLTPCLEVEESVMSPQAPSLHGQDGSQLHKLGTFPRHREELEEKRDVGRMEDLGL